MDQAAGAVEGGGKFQAALLRFKQTAGGIGAHGGLVAFGAQIAFERVKLVVNRIGGDQLGKYRNEPFCSMAGLGWAPGSWL